MYCTQKQSTYKTMRTTQELINFIETVIVEAGEFVSTLGAQRNSKVMMPLEWATDYDSELFAMEDYCEIGDGTIKLRVRNKRTACNSEYMFYNDVAGEPTCTVFDYYDSGYITFASFVATSDKGVVDRVINHSLLGRISS